MPMRFEGGIVRNPESDAVVAKMKGQARADAERLLALFRDVLPDAKEAIRWRVPMWFVDGQCVVFLMAFPKRVHAGFADGATLSDPEKLLDGTGKGFRHIKLEKGATDAQLRKYVRAAKKQAKQLARASGPKKAARKPAAK